MVNFNFGLGGSTKDDDKKDDASTQDDTSTQGVIAQDDTSVATDDTTTSDDLLTNNIEAEEIEEIKVTEPVFDGTVRESEVSEEDSEKTEGAFSPFDESPEGQAEEAVSSDSPVPEVPIFEIPAPVAEQKTEDSAKTIDPFLVEKTEERGDLNNDLATSLEVPTEEKTEEPVPIDTLTADSLAVEKTEGINNIVSSDEEVLPIEAEATTPSFEAPASAEAPIEIENLAGATETVKTAPAGENPFPSASVPVVAPVEPKIPSMGILPTMGVPEVKTEELKIEIPVESVTPLSSMTTDTAISDITEEKKEEKKGTPSLVDGKLPSIDGPAEETIPEIPTFGQPEKAVDDMLVPTSTDGDLFGGNTSDKPLDLGGETMIDPLAAAPVARIGEVPKKEEAPMVDMFGGNTEEVSLVTGNSTFGDDDDDDVNPAKNSSADPLEILQKLKDDISGFVEDHNAKIDGYNDQITELKKQIAEEKGILKDKQKKSKKILEDLTSLVSDFFHNETKKDSHKKEKNVKK